MTKTRETFEETLVVLTGINELLRDIARDFEKDGVLAENGERLKEKTEELKNTVLEIEGFALKSLAS